MDPQTAIFTRETYLPSGPERETSTPPGTGDVDVTVAPGGPGAGQLKLSPQAQELPALGLSMVKPCFSMVSAKSMTAPSR